MRQIYKIGKQPMKAGKNMEKIEIFIYIYINK